MRIFFGFLILMMLGLGAMAQTSKLQLASDVWPPFTDMEGKRAVALSLVQEALQRGGFTVEVEILAFGDVMKGIEAGEVDGSAALWRSPEREDYLLFSEPYLENRLILVGREGSDVSPTDFSALRGKRIGLVEDYAYGKNVNSAGEVEFVEGPSDQANLEALLRGELDYILVDGLLINYLLEYQADEAGQYLELGTTPLARRTLHFAVRKDRQGAEYIIQRFNAQVKSMIADGSFNRILQLNWIRSDVDGDGQEELVLGGKEAGVNPPIYNYDLLLGDSAMASQAPPLRYYIDGKVYESWEDVPARYKVPDVTEEDLNRPGLRLFEFRF